MLYLYKYNLQIDWIIDLISIIQYRESRSIPIKRDSIIENAYRKDINESI